jgi:hypothetical protein
VELPLPSLASLPHSFCLPPVRSLVAPYFSCRIGWILGRYIRLDAGGNSLRWGRRKLQHPESLGIANFVFLSLLRC